MSNIILIQDEDFKKLLYEYLDSYIKERGLVSLNGSNNVAEDELITNLVQISNLCHCSLPTAQKIKDAIPQDQYMQIDKTFAIKKSVLLKANNQRKKEI